LSGVGLKKFEYKYSSAAYMSPGSTSHSNYINQAMRGSLAAIQAQAGNLQALVRCPHGAPAGACPICAGKSGGGGGLEDLKKTGMSWNEAYYAWSRIQIAKLLASQSIENSNLEAAKASRQLIELLNSIGVLQKLHAFRTELQQYMAAFAQNMANIQTALLKVFTPVKTVVKTIIQTVNNTFMQLIGAVNKLAAIMGEQIRNINEQIRANIEKILRRLMALDVLSRLLKVFNDIKQEFSELMARKIKAINEKLNKLILLFAKKEKKHKKRKQQKNEDTELDYDAGPSGLWAAEL